MNYLYIALIVLWMIPVVIFAPAFYVEWVKSPDNIWGLIQVELLVFLWPLTTTFLLGFMVVNFIRYNFFSRL